MKSPKKDMAVTFSYWNCPMLVEESLAPQYIMGEDSPAPQCIVVEDSPVPMSGVKDRPCLVTEPPEPTEDQAGTTSPVPMSGEKRSSVPSG